MRIRRATAILLGLAACSSQPAPHDASLPEAAAPMAQGPRGQAVAGGVGLRAELTPMQQRIERLKERARHPQKAAPADERVLACRRNATGRDSLRQCLHSFSIEAPVEDAGPHRFGAVRPPVINPAWQIPDLYIHPGTGNDENTCTDSGHPCKRWAEIISRWETDQPAITTAVTIHILANWAQNTDPIHWRPIVLNGGVPVIQGTLLQQTTGTISSVVPKNRAAGQVLEATLPSGAAVQGMEIVNTTRGGNPAWVDEIVSGSTVLLTQPLPHGADDSWFGISSEPDNWANGDSIVAYLPTTINLVQFSNFLGNENSDVLVPALVDVWVQQTQGLGPNVPDSSVDFVLLDGVNCFQCRIDRQVNHAFGSAGPTTTANNYINDWLALGQIFQADSMYGGSAGVWDISTHTLFYGYTSIDLDARLHSNSYWQGSGQNFIGFVNFPSDVPAVSIFGETFLTTEAQLFGLQPVMYFSSSSTELRSRDGGRLYYTGPAASAFPTSPTLWIGDGTGTFATTMDRNVTGGPLYTRALSVAQLDTSIASGGLGGIGLDPSLSGGFIDVTKDTITSAPATYLNAGTAISLTPNSPGTGQLTIANTGVTSVAAGSGISLSGSTGAVTITNTSGGSGVTSVSGGTGINVSPTTGAAVVSLQTPVTVPNGGTGNTSLTAHSYVLGEASSPLSTVGPGTAAQLPASKGTSADPVMASVSAGTISSTYVGDINCDQILNVSGTNYLQCFASGLSGAILPNSGGGGFLQNTGTAGSPIWKYTLQPVWADSTAACGITTTLTTCTSITLTIASGQTAEIWITAWGENDDTPNPHVILMEVNNTAYGEFTTFITGSGPPHDNMATGTAMLIDTTVGTHAYNFQIALEEALGTGSVSCTRCSIRGVVH